MIAFYGMGAVIMRSHDIFIVFFTSKTSLFTVLLFLEGWDSTASNFCLVLVLLESLFTISTDL